MINKNENAARPVGKLRIWLAVYWPLALMLGALILGGVWFSWFLFVARSHFVVLGLWVLIPALMWIAFWALVLSMMKSEGEVAGGCVVLILVLAGFLIAGLAVDLIVARPVNVGLAQGLLRSDYTPVELSSTVEIEPNRFQRGEPGMVTITLMNSSDQPIELGNILLRLPADWSKGFVADYSQSTVPSTITTPSQVLGVVGLPGELRYEGRVLAPGEKYTISLRVIANEPGEYGGLRLQMGAKIGEWILAKVDRSAEPLVTVFP